MTLPNNAIIPIGNLSGSITTGGLVPGLPIWTGEASGSVASFPDGSANPIKSLDFSIEPIQEGSGDPSPQNVRAISGWTGANITVDGSCFDTLTPLYNASEYNQYFNKVTIQLDANTDYYINSNAPSGYNTGGAVMETTFIICPNGDSPTTTNYGIIQNVEKKITTKSSGILAIYYRKVLSLLSTIPITSPDQFKDGTYYLQITEKSTDGQRLGDTYPITWSEAGTVYGGTVDVTSGVLTVTNVIADLSQLIWEHPTNRSINRTLIGIIKPPPSNTSLGNYIAEKYKEVTENSTLTDGTYAVLSDGTLIFYYDGVNEPSGNFVYELITPITVQLTPTQITSLLGNNNIWSDTGEIDKVIYMRDWNIALNMLWEAVFG